MLMCVCFFFLSFLDFSLPFLLMLYEMKIQEKRIFPSLCVLISYSISILGFLNIILGLFSDSINHFSFLRSFITINQLKKFKNTQRNHLLVFDLKRLMNSFIRKTKEKGFQDHSKIKLFFLLFIYIMFFFCL